jgi:hypothetical protein
VRCNHDEGARIERLVLVASVTEENGTERVVVEADGGLPLYARAATLRYGLKAITSKAT